MARILTKNMTPIVIQEAPSGLEKLYNTVSNLAERYASPEYEQQQISNRQTDMLMLQTDKILLTQERKKQTDRQIKFLVTIKKQPLKTMQVNIQKANLRA